MSPPVAIYDGKVQVSGGKICRSCCGSGIDGCMDPNGCEGLAHQWLVDLHGTPWDGLYTVDLSNCGCASCPGGVCGDGRNLGSLWTYEGTGFTLHLAWQCLPSPNGQYWAVIVSFEHEGVMVNCWVKLAGVTNPCLPEGLYEENLCDDETDAKCWTEWCPTFYAEVSSVGELAFSAVPLQRSSVGTCKSCRGLA